MRSNYRGAWTGTENPRFLGRNASIGPHRGKTAERSIPMHDESHIGSDPPADIDLSFPSSWDVAVRRERGNHTSCHKKKSRRANPMLEKAGPSQRWRKPWSPRSTPERALDPSPGRNTSIVWAM